MSIWTQHDHPGKHARSLHEALPRLREDPRPGLQGRSPGPSAGEPPAHPGFRRQADFNEPILLYDTTGPYTDPRASIDLAAGLAPAPPLDPGSGDTEELAAFHQRLPATAERDPELASIRFKAQRKPLRAKAGRTSPRCTTPASD